MSTYTTTVTIPLTVIAEDRETAAGHVDALLAAILTDAAAHGAASAGLHVDPLRTVPAPAGNPRFIVQHGEAGIRRVIDLTTGKSVDGLDYTDFASAAAVRDRLNTGAVAR